MFNHKRAGGLVPGKTVTAEFAVHTLRTQTAGSIIRPASFTGVWGFKPSFGLIPSTGMLKTTDSLDTVGFFVGHTADLPHTLDALRGHGRDFPLSHAAFEDRPRQGAPIGRPWRVAVVRPPVWRHAPDYAVRAFDRWLKQLGGDARYEIVEAALARQVELARQMDRFLRGFDAMLTLSTAGEAPLRHIEEAPDSALMWTLTQLPSLSAPVFVSPRGLPFGLQLVARRYNDPLLLRFVDEAIERGHLPATSYGRTCGSAASAAVRLPQDDVLGA